MNNSLKIKEEIKITIFDSDIKVETKERDLFFRGINLQDLIIRQEEKEKTTIIVVAKPLIIEQ